jgi:hypothetical protein
MLVCIQLAKPHKTKGVSYSILLDDSDTVKGAQEHHRLDHRLVQIWTGDSSCAFMCRLDTNLSSCL